MGIEPYHSLKQGISGFEDRESHQAALYSRVLIEFKGLRACFQEKEKLFHNHPKKGLYYSPEAIMKAMVLKKQQSDLEWTDVPEPFCSGDQVLVKVEACAVCRTDLHVIDGDLKNPVLPIIPGHEIIGRVIKTGNHVQGFQQGDRVGIPWLGWTCGRCAYCLNGQENLCDNAKFTGYHINGGYAGMTVADGRYCFPVNPSIPAENAAPLMCAGLIGYRSYRMTGDASIIGLYGFGAAAHIIAPIAVGQGKTVYAFTKPDDAESQDFALSLGVHWAGSVNDPPPEQLDAAIIFAPAGELVPAALSCTRKGGVIVCAGIHMSDIPSFPYRLLWEERRIISVANLTRQDGIEFMELVSARPVHTTVTVFPLHEANRAVGLLRRGCLQGAAVLVP